mmetsp:Transcript_42730/g.105324  ORF Transcript_42730/g.105324 Transcript_42730/m.105324 type:complete len:300 (-) Transcript_42730:102-1001(-)
MMDAGHAGPSRGLDDLDKPRFLGTGAAMYTGLTVALYPLHSQKTRSQTATQGGPRPGLLAPRAYRGLAAAVMGALPARMCYIFALEAGGHHATTWLAGRGLKPEAAASLGGAVGGASAAMTSMLVYVPFDIISQQQIVSKGTPESTLAIARRIVSTEGFPGLYRGMGITMITYLPSSALWWGLYKATHKSIERTSPLTPTLLVEVASATVAGAFTSTLTMPLDAIKTRTQVQSANGGEAVHFVRVARELVATEGICSLWRGVFWRGTHTIIWGCTMVVCYEQLKRWAAKTKPLARSRNE